MFTSSINPKAKFLIKLTQPCRPTVPKFDVIFSALFRLNYLQMRVSELLILMVSRKEKAIRTFSINAEPIPQRRSA